MIIRIELELEEKQLEKYGKKFNEFIKQKTQIKKPINIELSEGDSRNIDNIKRIQHDRIINFLDFNEFTTRQIHHRLAARGAINSYKNTQRRLAELVVMNKIKCKNIRGEKGGRTNMYSLL